MATRLEEYRARQQGHEARRDRLEAAASRVANWRLLAFFLAVILMLSGGAWTGAGAIVALGFVRLVARHRVLRTQVDLASQLAWCNAQAAHRSLRHWDGIELPHHEPASQHHPYAGDLDIMGAGGLLHLLGPAATPLGARQLRAWLLDPPPADQVAVRQECISELAGLTDFRDRLLASGRLAGRMDPAGLLEMARWARSPEPFAGARALLLLSFVLPICTWGLVWAHAAGHVPWLWSLPAALSATTIWWFRTAIRPVLTSAAPHGVRGRGLSRVFDAACGFRLNSDLGSRLQASLAPADGLAAHEALRRLEVLNELADARHSQYLHVLAQLFLMWDAHVVLALDRWRRRSGRHLPQWLQTIGEIDALATLGALAHMEPTWTLPSFTESTAPRLTASQLGHPLLPRESCVRNDVEIGPPGRILVISGSNMSGKSTLERAIGTNVILARLGAPVCANAMSLPAGLAVFTCMRVHDSLLEGVSHFLAEVRRLKAMLDGCHEPGRGAPVLCLMDEILQGTNAAERREGVLRILRRLVRLEALVALATHDLSFRDAADIEERCHHVHLRDVLDESARTADLRFDYRLRPGVLGAGNALRVMDAVGLSEGG